ncbi:hypothetical protein QFZ27_004480 [Inquilinus ginsengisoli]|uniref:hypothetical protein n=1 Tax=Inquilinus ginsengisoli TaxID=363840 RepID=UPI003D1BAD56
MHTTDRLWGATAALATDQPAALAYRWAKLEAWVHNLCTDLPEFREEEVRAACLRAMGPEAEGLRDLITPTPQA